MSSRCPGDGAQVYRSLTGVTAEGEKPSADLGAAPAAAAYPTNDSLGLPWWVNTLVAACALGMLIGRSDG